LKTNHKFEPGIQHYSGAIGFGAAVDYLSKLGMKNVEAYEHKLADKMNETLNSVPGVEIYGPEFSDKHGALFSFNIKGAKPHEVALLLDKPGIAVRSGVFCAQPAMEAMGQKDGAVRASLYIYNTEQEIEFFGEKLGKIAQLYR
jgi:cysteine desulfurase/selenocysteine lyase